MEQQYVILLKKVTKANGCIDDSWLPKSRSQWISMGRFDEIYVYPLESNDDAGFFSNMQKNKELVLRQNNESVHYHPLYLVSHQNKVVYTKDTSQFWYIAIARLHLSKTHELKKQLDSLYGHLNGDLPSDLICQFYYATEFSDMVLDIRSNRISSVMNFVLKLRKYAEIGKIYTYFGINAARLEDNNSIESEDDTIPFFSVRFNGTNMHATFEQLNMVKENLGNTPEYSVNGVDDILLVYNDLPAAKVINLFRNLKYSDSIVRVGIAVTANQEFADTTTENNDLSTICESLHPLRKRINALIAQRSSYDYGWLTAITEITNSLIHMGRSPIMDEVVYLLLPGVKVFIENIIVMIEQQHTVKKDLIPMIYSFTESCTCYLEQLIRIEGQLSQQPEIRPAIYNIPVFMLEYIQAFLHEVSELLQKEDTPLLGHVFVLVPRPCERIEAVELFPASSHNSGLVKLQIPERLLYSPREIMRMLCHEASHYVGDRFRNRKKRIQCYARATAAILCREFFSFFSYDLFVLIYRQFKDELNNSNLTIRDMSKTIRNMVYNTFTNPDAYCNFVKTYLETNKAHPVDLFGIDTIYKKLEQFDHVCKSIDILFREVYADVCMLYLLNVNTDEYIEGLLQELSDSPDRNNISKDAFAIRIYASLSAFGDEFEYHGSCYRDIWKDIARTIDNIVILTSKKTNSELDLPIPMNSIVGLRRYAKECSDDMMKTIAHKSLENIRGMYTVLSADDFNYDFILNKIEHYRRQHVVPVSQS